MSGFFFFFLKAWRIGVNTKAKISDLINAAVQTWRQI